MPIYPHSFTFCWVRNWCRPHVIRTHARTQEYHRQTWRVTKRASRKVRLLFWTHGNAVLSACTHERKKKNSYDVREHTHMGKRTRPYHYALLYLFATCESTMKRPFLRQRVFRRNRTHMERGKKNKFRLPTFLWVSLHLCLPILFFFFWEGKQLNYCWMAGWTSLVVRRKKSVSRRCVLHMRLWSPKQGTKVK